MTATSNRKLVTQNYSEHEKSKKRDITRKITVVLQQPDSETWGSAIYPTKKFKKTLKGNSVNYKKTQKDNSVKSGKQCRDRMRNLRRCKSYKRTKQKFWSERFNEQNVTFSGEH